MKTLSSPVVCLVLSLSLVGHVMALQDNSPINNLNRQLQNKIDKQVTYFFKQSLEQQQEKLFFPAVPQEKIQSEQSDIFSVPDCLCHLSIRVI